MEAVNYDGCALGYVSEELKRDRDVAMEAVKQCGCALQCASERILIHLHLIASDVAHPSFDNGALFALII